ncbi:MAG: hypothetical protein LKJ03_08665 [Enterococcaceae bacterium]|jgi:hypothetical protein|nr:hypothetical protein [Enterococcaceae bacterium]
MNTEIDAGKMIEKLLQRITILELENAKLEVINGEQSEQLEQVKATEKDKGTDSL